MCFNSLKIWFSSAYFVFLCFFSFQLLCCSFNFLYSRIHDAFSKSFDFFLGSFFLFFFSFHQIFCNFQVSVSRLLLLALRKSFATLNFQLAPALALYILVSICYFHLNFCKPFANFVHCFLFYLQLVFCYIYHLADQLLFLPFSQCFASFSSNFSILACNKTFVCILVGVLLFLPSFLLTPCLIQLLFSFFRFQLDFCHIYRLANNKLLLLSFSQSFASFSYYLYILACSKPFVYIFVGILLLSL